MSTTPRKADTAETPPPARYPTPNAPPASTAPGTSARSAIWRSGWCLFPVVFRIADDHQPGAPDRADDQADREEQRVEPEQAIEHVPDASPGQKASQERREGGPADSGIPPAAPA